MCIARCLDCLYSLSSAPIEGGRQEILKAVSDAEKNAIPLLRVIKNAEPEWNNAVYLIRYQMLSLLEAYKWLV